jgi:hypothetical protein
MEVIMKTLKFALVAAIVACTMVSLANADGFKSKPKKAVNMTFANAIQNPELVVAMYQQLDPVFLKKVEQLYVVEVSYNGAVYRILGSRQNWLMFFKLKWRSPIGSNSTTNALN